MSDYDPRTNRHLNPTPKSGGGLYVFIGVLLVTVLIGAYFLLGAPGLHSNVARAPDRDVDATMEERRPPPAERVPAMPRP
jgi:hypothetical protein